MSSERRIPVPLLLPIALAATAAQAQVLPIDPLVAALTQRVDGLETRLDTTNVTLTANVNALNNVQAQIAIDAAAITQLDARVTLNAQLISANGVQDAVQVGRIDVLEGRAAASDAANAARDAAAAATNLRDDAQDVRIAAGATLQAGQTGRLNAVEAQAGAAATRADGLDARLAANVTVDAAQDVRLAAGEARDAAQDGAIATNTARIDDHETRIAANTAGLGALRADVDAGRAGLVRQSGPTAPVTVAATTGGTSVVFTGTGGDRRLSGVADGVAANDAVTMSQLAARATGVLAAANAYTDRSITAILDANERQLAANNGVLRRDLRAIASGTTAIAGLPQSFIPGKGMVGLSIGGTGGEAAVAVGLSKAFAGENPLVLRGGLAFDTRRGDATYNAAVGIHF